MDQTEFLSRILGSEKGLVCLARVGSGGEMVRSWVDYPSPGPYLDPEWPYFLPALFDEIDGEGRTRVVAVNVDEVDNIPKAFTPSLLINTSQSRVVAYYLLTDTISFEESRVLAKKVAPDCDPSSYMRLPGLVNEKYEKPFTVEVSRASLIEYQTSTIRRLPEPNGTAVKALADWTWEPTGIGPKEFLRDMVDHDRVPSRLVGATANGAFDECLRLIALLDIPETEKVYLLKHVSKNPFLSLKEVGRETAKALARYTAQQGQAFDPLVLELDRARKNRTGAAFVRQRAIGDIAKRELTGAGTFMHSVDDHAYYIERDSGQAIQLSTHSEKFKYLIVRRLRINPIDREFKYIVEELIASTMNLPPVGLPTSLSWFDGNTKSLTVNLGGSRGLRISPSNADLTENGTNNLIFKTPPKFEPISLDLIDLQTDLSGWWEEFFPGMPNLIGMTEEQASALLRVWITFFFFQSGASTWPLLVFIGQMGSSKSALGRSIYRLIYGVQMDLIRMRSQSAFDTALSNHAIAFFDNVDTKNPWLAESLATAISRTEDDKRKLYTDNDLFSVRNQAMVGITSKDVPFLKEDIIDRMLYFNFIRLEDLGIELIPEQFFHNKTTSNRHRYISGLLQDCRKVLSTPRPASSGIQWRIADFVDIGYWIATALGIEKPYIEGLQKLKKQQRGLTLEGDQPLVTALEHFAAKCKDAARWRTSGEFRDDLMLYAPDDVARAIEARYKSASVLSQKLYSVVGILKSILPIEYEFNEDTGFKRWRIAPPAAPAGI